MTTVETAAVDHLRERAQLALAVVPDGHRVTRKVRAVGMLRRAPGGERWTLAELGDAVEWAMRQPAEETAGGVG
jgi:hypothetical protein